MLTLLEHDSHPADIIDFVIRIHSKLHNSDLFDVNMKPEKDDLLTISVTDFEALGLSIPITESAHRKVLKSVGLELIFEYTGERWRIFSRSNINDFKERLSLMHGK